MNVWRWLGTGLFLVVLGVGVTAQGQDKKDKQDDKKADKKDEKKDDKKADKKDDKKDDKGSGITLAWKAFDTPGKTFYQELRTDTVQNMKVMNMAVKQTQKQTFYISWTPEKKDKDNYVVKQKIIGVKMDIEIGGNKISYDSTAKEQPANPLTDFFKALVGSEFTLTIDPQTLKVTKIDGRDKFIGDLSKANPQLKPLLEAILSESALKQMADPVFSAIPKGGNVPADKTWQETSVLDMGPIGTYTTKYNYKYDGEKGGVATIGVTTDLTYEAPKGKSSDGLPFRITTADLKSKKGSGTVSFDTKAGRVAESKMELELGGKLSIDIAGMTTEVELTQTQRASLKTTDDDPTKAGKK